MMPPLQNELVDAYNNESLSQAKNRALLGEFAFLLIVIITVEV